jgi:6-phosphogluconolactonase (cycloisomerase 2 family)
VDSGTASPTATYTLSATVTCHNGPRAAYVANYSGNTVSQYALSATDGSLSAIAPGTVSTNTNPSSVAMDPTGRYAYTADFGSNKVSQYTIGAGGALTPMATAFLATGIQPISVVLR